MSVLIVGCGYTGRRLAQRLRALGKPVRATAARPASIAALESAGIAALHLTLDAPSPSIGVEPSPSIEVEKELVYYLVPPPPEGVGDPRLERFLGALEGAPSRLVYMSTTGVYGDHGGGRVDEDTSPNPESPRARRRLAAEATLCAWSSAHNVSWTVLRVPGIYGPGRLPLERLAAGTPALKHEEALPGNRIHVEDLVSACIAAGSSASADRRIFNVTDGSDESQTAWLERVARLAGLPPPPLVSREEARARLSSSAYSFLCESRRVDSRRMREELGVALAYGDLDAGIRASLAQPL
jgi:nucleoside-diphosphate-sugar epimerase